MKPFGKLIKISQNSNNNNAWNLDWSTSSTTVGVANLETALNQDINDKAWDRWGCSKNRSC